MTVPVLLGLVCGVGLWLAAVALRPRPVPLAQALADLNRPPSAAAPASAGPITGRLLELFAALGIRTPQREQQLALAGITAESWARDKLIGATGGLAVPLMVWVALTAIGIQVPPAVSVLVLAGGVAGWFLPDLKLKEQVEQRRKAFQYALSAYLDLVNVILAGGGGIETALVAAADAGDGWAFARLRHALHRAQRINQPLWTAFDDLGAELGVAELRDLASSIGLAGAQGARIRASLAVKADTLRSHQIAETEAAAEATTERMNLPTAVLLLGFLIFIVFPAVTAITGVSSGTCVPGEPDCPTPATSTPRPANRRSDPTGAPMIWLHLQLLALAGFVTDSYHRLKDEEDGLTTTEIAVVTFLLVGAAIMVMGIIYVAARNNADNIPVPEAPA